MTLVNGVDPSKQSVSLRCNAWYGDAEVALKFPNHWKVQIFGNQPHPALGADAVMSAMRQPIGTVRLDELAAEKKRAAILVDDLDRPTPVGVIIPHVMDELKNAGMSPQSIKVVICGGTHGFTEEEIARKLMITPPAGIQVLQNDSHKDQVYLGKSELGTPIWVNRTVYESDLKIGIGCILPHPAAGFSGGSKLLTLGAGGYDTIRIVHDQRATARLRGGSIRSEFRRDIEQIAEQIGLDFIINVVLNQDREITRLFCGHPWLAFEQGVGYVKKHFCVLSPPKDTDIVVTDFYPCDTTLQQGFDRGLWPLLQAPANAIKVIAAGCPRGKGVHELFPVSNPFHIRLLRRLRYLRMVDILSIGKRLRALKTTINRRSMEVLFLSPNLLEEEAQASLPKSKVFQTWDALLAELTKRHEGKKQVNVVVYRCAPLMLPENEQG